MAYLKLLSISLLFMFSISKAFAQQTPNQWLSSVGNHLFTQISKIDSQHENKQQALQKIVSRDLMPHVDLQYVSYKLLGKHIKTVNKEQILEFMSAVETYLTSTYATALMNYNNQQVLFDEKVEQQSDKFATVKTRIINEQAPAIDLQFKLRLDKDGEWKIYDMVAEGISLLGAKQTEISRRISSVGLTAVIAELNR